jgi:hypothetical protein
MDIFRRQGRAQLREAAEIGKKNCHLSTLGFRHHRRWGRFLGCFRRGRQRRAAAAAKGITGFILKATARANHRHCHPALGTETAAAPVFGLASGTIHDPLVPIFDTVSTSPPDLVRQPTSV